MKPCLFLLLAFCGSSILVVQAQSLAIPCGNSIESDGVVRPAEWADADSLSIDIQGNRTVTILHKHDSLQLYFAFLGHLQSSMARFPEVMIDTDHSGGTSWDSKDWWFHVSATDCEYQGAHSTYDSCAIERPTWKGAPNIPAGIPEPPYVDTIEIAIPLSTLGSLGNTFGIAFDVTNTFNSWEYWPASAKIGEPGTWSSATLSPCNPSAVGSAKALAFQLFPNPATQHIHVKFNDISTESGRIEVYNMLGSLVYSTRNLSGIGKHTLDIGDWPTGTYLIVYKQNHHTSRLLFEKS